MVFLSKTIFFLGKTKKTIFLVSGRIVSQKMFFLWVFWVSLGKRWFSFPKPSFSRKKLVFHAQTIFFLGKSWFSCPEASFSWEKVGFPVQNHLFPRKKLVFLSKTIFFLGKTQKTIFLVSGRIVSQKMFFLVFWVFPRKSWFLIGRAQCCR